MNAAVAEQKQDEVAEFRAPGPGERLKKARLAKDLDLSRMADRLHLTSDMVEAIECDDYSEMPARVFVRGYIRNYARAVDLPADSIISQFDQLWPDDDAHVRVDTAPRLPADTRPGNSWAGMVTWLLLLAVIVLFLMWWQGYLDRFAPKGDTGQPVLEQAVKPQVAPQPQAGLALPDKPQPPAQAPQPIQGEGLLPLPAAPAAVIPEPPASTTKPELPAADEPETTAPAGALSLPAASAEPEAAAPASEAPAPAAVEPPVAAAVQVVVSFEEDCWVDIRDSSREFRLFGTMRKGTVKTLQGEPPYKMVLGNAKAVAVSVDGKAFDLAPHSRDNIARFTLSP